MCSGSETGSYLRLIDFVYHSTLGLIVTKKKTKNEALRSAAARAAQLAPIPVPDFNHEISIKSPFPGP